MSVRMVNPVLIEVRAERDNLARRLKAVTQQRDALLAACRSASELLYLLADVAGDCPTWNKGGTGYEVVHELRAALDACKPDRA